MAAIITKMKIMKMKINKTILLLAVLLWGAPIASALAVSETPPLAVVFETNPLFSEADIIPGDGVTKTVTVTNNSEESQQVITEAINASDDSGLGEALKLVISGDSGEIYGSGKTLGDFLRAGEVKLSVLPAGATEVYSFIVSFGADADDSTQNGEIGFDLCVGFEGGNTSCGDTEIGGEGEGGGDNGGTDGTGETVPGTGGGGGGGANGPVEPFEHLKIANETATPATPLGTAVITWDTNILSTSQVIYGIASEGPYQLSLATSPYFGYPNGTSEDRIKVTRHSVTLTGLAPDTLYKYRVISRASPPTISYEKTFIINTAPPAEEFSGGNGGAGEQGGAENGDGGNSGGGALAYGTKTSDNSFGKSEGGGETLGGGEANGGGGENLNTENNNKDVESGGGEPKTGGADGLLGAAAAFLGLSGGWGKAFNWLLLILLVIIIIAIRRATKDKKRK
ncbi:MAG: hypothetical protein GXP44_02380 [bacterium]|nr:hypothetical protein [bacterium]